MVARKKRTAPPKHEPKAVSRREEFRLPVVDVRILNVAMILSFFAFCVWYVSLRNADFLYVLQEYDLFLWNRSFLFEHLRHVGEPFRYAASFLIQFSCYPFLGGLIYTFLLLTTAHLTSLAFRIPPRFVVVSFAPALMILFHFTDTGILLFKGLPLTYLWGVPLGVIASLGFVILYVRITSPWLRLSFGCCGGVILYYFAGIFSLLGLYFCVLHEFLTPGDKRRFYRAGVLACCGVIVPPAFWCCHCVMTPLEMVYLVGFPNYTGPELEFTLDSSHYPILVLLLLPWVVPLISGKERAETPSRNVGAAAFLLNLVVLLASCHCVVRYAANDADFLELVRMGRLLEERRWEEMLQVRDSLWFPVRAKILMRDLALWKTGQIGDRKFYYPYSCRPDLRWAAVGTVRVFGPNILLEFGLPRMAYKAAMNQFVSKEANLSNLKTLARCAAENDESALAEKYLEPLEDTLFHRGWVKRFRDGREAAPKITAPDAIELDTSADAMIFNEYGRTDYDAASPEVKQLRLMQLLLSKDIKGFLEYWQRWIAADQPTRMPTHFQEALLLCSSALDTKIEGLEKWIAPEVASRYREFHTTTATLRQQGRQSQLPYKIAERFPETYWCFYCDPTPWTVY